MPAPQPCTKAQILPAAGDEQPGAAAAGSGRCMLGYKKKKRKMQSFLTKGKCCIPAESLWLPTHPLDPGYLQAKHKTKDICLKPTGGHCDSIEEKNTTGVHSKNFPPLGLGFKTSTGQRGQNTLRADACKRFQGKLVMWVLTKIKLNPMFTKGKKGSFPRRQSCKHPLQISQDLSEASMDSSASEVSSSSCASVCSEGKGKGKC